MADTPDHPGPEHDQAHTEAAAVDAAGEPQERELTPQEVEAIMAAARQEATEDAAVAIAEEPHNKAIKSGVIKNMAFEQALQLALGTKSIYFSASNPNIQSPEGVNSVSDKGATYLRPDKDLHIVQAHVLDHSIQGQLLENAHEEDKLCDLPLAYSLKTEKKPIAQITDEEAKAAGYSRRALQLRLALQTEHAFDFSQQLSQIAAQKTLGMISPGQNEAAVQTFLGHIIPMVIEGLRFGRIKSDESTARQALAIVNAMLDPALIPDSAIPGTADVFSIGVATPAELVEAGQAPDEATAKKIVGEALHTIHHPVSHSFGLTNKPIRDAMGELYGPRKFESMLRDLKARAEELLPSVTAKPELSLEGRIKISGGTIGDWNRGKLLYDLAQAGDDAEKIAAVQTAFEEAQASAKAMGDLAPKSAYVR